MMSENKGQGKSGTIADLKNVHACMVAMERLIERGPGRPGIGVFHGHSGYGKTYAAIYVQNMTRAVRVEIGDSWTRKVVLEKLAAELGVDTRGTIAQLVDRVVETLVDDDRPVIIDEADKLCDKHMIEMVRELHEASGAPFLLIGEEKLPAKIAEVERVHNRVLVWEPAQRCDQEDSRKLVDLLSPAIHVSDDLVSEIRERSSGRARLIVVNTDEVITFARRSGLSEISLANYSGPWVDGRAPRPRAA